MKPVSKSHATPAEPAGSHHDLTHLAPISTGILAGIERPGEGSYRPVKVKVSLSHEEKTGRLHEGADDKPIPPSTRHPETVHPATRRMRGRSGAEDFIASAMSSESEHVGSEEDCKTHESMPTREDAPLALIRDRSRSANLHSYSTAAPVTPVLVEHHGLATIATKKPSPPSDHGRGSRQSVAALPGLDEAKHHDDGGKGFMVTSMVEGLRATEGLLREPVAESPVRRKRHDMGSAETSPVHLPTGVKATSAAGFKLSDASPLLGMPTPISPKGGHAPKSPARNIKRTSPVRAGGDEASESKRGHVRARSDDDSVRQSLATEDNPAEEDKPRNILPSSLARVAHAGAALPDSERLKPKLKIIDTSSMPTSGMSGKASTSPVSRAGRIVLPRTEHTRSEKPPGPDSEGEPRPGLSTLPGRTRISPVAAGGDHNISGLAGKLVPVGDLPIRTSHSSLKK